MLRRKLDVDAPAAADAFDVETFAENADLAPGVPIGGNEDFVAVDDVVSEGLALEQGVDAEGGMDQGGEGVGDGDGGVD